MKANKFISLKSIQGVSNHVDFHRKNGNHCVPGVYFWGFTLKDDGGLPTKKEELIIYYIGKSKSNVSERIMQEITQLLFGGFGTIIDKNWLSKKYCTARIKNEQDKKTNNVIYTSEGLHMLYYFFTDQKIVDTINWMKDRLIFTWIDCKMENVAELEKEMHHIVRTNVLGVGLMRNLNPKMNYFKVNQKTLFHNKIDWSENPILNEWLIEVNKNIN